MKRGQMKGCVQVVCVSCSKKKITDMIRATYVKSADVLHVPHINTQDQSGVVAILMHCLFCMYCPEILFYFFKKYECVKGNGQQHFSMPNNEYNLLTVSRNQSQMPRFPALVSKNYKQKNIDDIQFNAQLKIVDCSQYLISFLEIGIFRRNQWAWE